MHALVLYHRDVFPHRMRMLLHSIFSLTLRVRRCDLAGDVRRLLCLLYITCRRLAGLARAAGQRAGEAGEPPDVGAGLGLDHVALPELPGDGAAGRLEDGAVHEQVALRVPHPVLPLRLRRVVALRDLLRWPCTHQMHPYTQEQKWIGSLVACNY